MATLLPEKTSQRTPFATSDTHYESLVADPQVEHSNILNPNDTVNPKYSSSIRSFHGATSTTDTTITTISSQAQNIQSSGGALHEGATLLVEPNGSFGDFINKKWRPALGWIYMLTCTCDFIIFPVLWSLLQAISKGQVTSQWQPLTLQGGGLYHIALGTVLGITAYGRTQEKMAGKS